MLTSRQLFEWRKQRNRRALKRRNPGFAAVGAPLRHIHAQHPRRSSATLAAASTSTRICAVT